MNAPNDVLGSAELRQAAAEFLAKEAGSARVRAVVDAGGVPDEALVAAAARIGWFGLEVPVQLGGSGAGFAELLVLIEETGAHAASLPLVSSAALGIGALLVGGSEAQQRRWLPGLAVGTQRGTALLPGVFQHGDTLTAQCSRDGWLLDGTCRHVLDARGSELHVVVAGFGASHAEPVVAVVERDTPGVAVEPLAMTDKTRGVDTVHFDRVRVPAENVLAHGHDARRLAAALINRMAAAIAADSLGIARRVLDMTVSYACQRKQFQRLIGSFQAVKHQAADMFVDLQTSRALVADAAGKVASHPAGDGGTEAASMAKSHACEKAAHSAGVAVQLHGGIGYTWEHDLHLYLKRSKLNEQLAGDARWHRSRIAAHVLNSRT